MTFAFLVLREMKMPKSKTEIVWFARGGGIAKMGPYRNQIEAVNSLRLRKTPKSFDADLFPPDAFVWPEYAPKERKTKNESRDSNSK